MGIYGLIAQWYYHLGQTKYWAKHQDFARFSTLQGPYRRNCNASDRCWDAIMEYYGEDW